MSGIYILSQGTPSRRVEDAATKATVPAKRKAQAKPTGVYVVPQAPAKSKFVSNLAGIATKAPGSLKKDLESSRSTSFSQRPAPPPPPPPSDFASVGRDDTLKVVENLKMGPYEHKQLPDDPEWKTVEPHSGIRLSKRVLPHEDFSDMLRARYYISPSTLYSVVRLSSHNTYDVPVDSDWVTIAVVAERGPIKMSMRHGGADQTDDKDEQDPSKFNPVKAAASANAAANANGKDKAADKDKGKEKAKDQRKPTGKKFMTLKLVDFGTRTDAAANAQKQIRGDAQLSLLLFEADSYSVQTDAMGAKTRVYRGGSRGAFEGSARLRTGAVVAILNPRILKPMSALRDARPDQTSNLLALTPESDESIVVLGYSKDLGACTARKRDGQPCGSWCDKRTSEVCDYHVQQAVQSRRASRPEFTAGTSGMATFAQRQAQTRKPTFDPVRKIGLLPKEREDKALRGQETYVVGGHTISALSPTLDFVHEKIGRQREARKARKRADDTLELLLERDLENAHEDVGRDMVRNAMKVLGRHKEKDKDKDSPEAKEEQDKKDEQREKAARKVFDAATVKALGFDPLLLSAKNKAKPVDDIDAGRKLALLTASAAARTIKLGRRPGDKIRSGIVKPAAGPSNSNESDDDLEITPSKNDDDMEVVPTEAQPSADVDDDLEIGASEDGEYEDEQPVGRPSKKRRLSVPEDEYDEEPLAFPDSDDD